MTEKEATNGVANEAESPEIKEENMTTKGEAVAEPKSLTTTSLPFSSPLFQLLLAQKVYELGDKEETFARITNDINEHPLLLDQIPEIETSPISRDQCYQWYLEQLESEGLEQGKGQWIMQLAQSKYDKFVEQLESEIEQDGVDFIAKVGEIEEMSKQES
ncbi:hypothetical protein B0I72DRAFT_135934 [Yarrowia lipolytica]|uniref:YALI0D04070p n=2 Tax=Yarrowia lipolytica TaxID=4952 RepID=Q6CAC4_YARLI|nr:YALI0D04070p [Yarrowia lipolytica CLIB122]AOW03554.1 hypothetical protein YALI1_D05099g [Yarrowia lipolytica]KAB8284675.1 hypothetical protein BKA91DRAFT_134690 [Yarrowia lipolytica]KAE8171300.1 hypothetical protein BKA90DRAFT_139327 [Yarrowia lipolytica]KAJ8054818.1 hypothetical protein LXG23DRAFT_56374 [Yarrowia lipolytica]QNP98607.1 Hypothetical protein YALI2_D01048g [Yarrowia lipolytica]|eukprot:XP_502388.1 YALI0D04070p [Yarrowia lipolytica CLIB122]